MSEKSPVVESLNAIAGAVGRNTLDGANLNGWHKRETNVDTAVFSYSRDFACLWGLQEGQRGLHDIVGGLAEAQVAGEFTLVIVWDGMPQDSSSDGVAASRYVTPYDWALALSVALSRRKWVVGDFHPKLQMLILDIRSDQGSASFMKQSFFAFHNALPWVQDYRPVMVGEGSMAEAAVFGLDCDTFALLRQAIPPGRCDAERLISDLLQPKCVVTTFSDDSGWADGLDAVVESWKQQFLRTGDHHAVANLTAPLVLAAGLPADVREYTQQLIEQKALPRRALRELLQQADLLNIKEKASGGGSPVSLLSRDGGVFGRCKDVRFLLVDDQYRLGYHHILAYTLFGTGYNPNDANEKGHSWYYTQQNHASLSCMVNADALLAVLKIQKPVEDWSLPRCLDVPDGDVLLLDLRLWEEKRDDLRRTFMKDVVTACRYLGADTLDDPVFRRAFQAAEALAENKEASEIPALTLLPLLLSHYDPSLPIILFSSTHQREVIEMVSHRPNIITNFAKPVLSRYEKALTPEPMINNLRDALQQAIGLHEVRIVWNRIINTDWKEAPAIQVLSGAAAFDRETYNGKDDNKTHAPSIKGNTLKKVMAEWYVHYIQTGCYYDFASVPYEFIEGCLTPTHIASHFTNPGFDVVTKGNSVSTDMGHRNQIARVLQNIRNRKVHGHVHPFERGKPTSEWRLSAILEFMLLLDYVEARKSSADKSGVEQLYKNAWKLVWNAKKSLGLKPRKPQGISSHDDIPWFLFVLYSSAFSIYRSQQGEEIYVARESYKVLKKIVAFSKPSPTRWGDSSTSGQDTKKASRTDQQEKHKKDRFAKRKATRPLARAGTNRQMQNKDATVKKAGMGADILEMRETGSLKAEITVVRDGKVVACVCSKRKLEGEITAPRNRLSGLSKGECVQVRLSSILPVTFTLVEDSD